MKLQVTVGVREKHVVSFSYNRFSGIASIFSDEGLIRRGLPDSAEGVIQSYTFSIGTTEPHQIKIEREHRRPLAGFRDQPFRVFIDNNLVSEAVSPSNKFATVLFFMVFVSVAYCLFMRK